MRARTIVYIDGFNFYYRCLKNTPYKWLDLSKFISMLLPSEKHELLKIKFFTARIDARPNNPNAPDRQSAYLKALERYCPNVEIIYGHFLSHSAKRPYAPPKNGWADVILTEEKGTDVNLAVHLLNDAWLDAYDCAVVVSNDSDLAESMRMAKERKKLIGWIVTGNQHPSQVLAKIAQFRKPVRNSALAKSQLPDVILGTTIRKPSSW